MWIGTTLLRRRAGAAAEKRRLFCEDPWAIERMLETKRITVKAPPLPVADFLTTYTDLAKLRHLSKAAGLHILLTDFTVDPA